MAPECSIPFPAMEQPPGKGQVGTAQMQGIISSQEAQNERLLTLYGLVSWGKGKGEGLGVERD